MIRILICDDQAIARQGLQVLLETAPDISVVGTAQDGKEATEQVQRHLPDLVLMDLKMPRMNGVQATRWIREHHPDVKVLVLTTYDTDDWVFDSLRNGAHGFLLKDALPEQILDAIRGTVDDKNYLAPEITGKVLQQWSRTSPRPEKLKLFEELNKREHEILCILAKGHSNIEIAKELHLSEGTVRNYISHIFLKLGVNDRTKAAVMAIRHGLID